MNVNSIITDIFLVDIIKEYSSNNIQPDILIINKNTKSIVRSPRSTQRIYNNYVKINMIQEIHIYPDQIYDIGDSPVRVNTELALNLPYNCKIKFKPSRDGYLSCIRPDVSENYIHNNISYKKVSIWLRSGVRNFKGLNIKLKPSKSIGTLIIKYPIRLNKPTINYV